MAEEEQITWEEFLQDAARYGDFEDVQAALANKANVDAADEFGRTGRGCHNEGRFMEEKLLLTCVLDQPCCNPQLFTWQLAMVT
jgi:hypothetical protein